MTSRWFSQKHNGHSVWSGRWIDVVGLTESHRSGLNRRPLDYESSALPLSYGGERVPWRGLEPRRLSAPPPQDGVSTNFTTRASTAGIRVSGGRGIIGTSNAPLIPRHLDL